jgi:hypothetical protein
VEFEAMVSLLRSKGVTVHVLPSPDSLPSDVDSASGVTPDAVFPNNWFSSHRCGTQALMILYPMLTLNRALEKRNTENVRNVLAQTSQGQDVLVFDLAAAAAAAAEGSGHTSAALEGTGAIVFDRWGKTAYITVSARAQHEQIYQLFGSDVICDLTVLGATGNGSESNRPPCTGCSQLCALYSKVVLVTAYMQPAAEPANSTDDSGATNLPVYHTNVILAIGEKWAVCCLEAIEGAEAQARVRSSLGGGKRLVIAITTEQVRKMCGNILEVQGEDEQGQAKRLIVLSATAVSDGGFSSEQKQALAGFGELVVCTIPTIETVGGGSARCCVAEVFA